MINGQSGCEKINAEKNDNLFAGSKLYVLVTGIYEKNVGSEN